MAEATEWKGLEKEDYGLMTQADQDDTIQFVLEKTFENIIHDIVASVHRAEKLAKAESAVIQVRQKEERVAKQRGIDLSNDDGSQMPVVETDGAVIKEGKAYLKGNPLQTTKNIICPNCKLPRLLYPRVGYGARDPPDPNQQYCKNEPPIIIDKHDVHGQRKKGTKLKGPAKGKQKKNEVPSPGSSNGSAPPTPGGSSFPSESFEFKTIDYPSAKCPNRDSALGDHWKTVTIMASHLNGNCYLKRDRAAGREAVAKMSGTPAESRATSPKPVANGKRGRIVDDEADTGGSNKKKQKLDAPKKLTKKGNLSPSKLKDVETSEKDQPAATKVELVEDSIKIHVKPKKQRPNNVEAEKRSTPEPDAKPHVNGVKDSGGKLKLLKLNGKHKSSSADSG